VESAGTPFGMVHSKFQIGNLRSAICNSERSEGITRPLVVACLLVNKLLKEKISDRVRDDNFPVVMTARIVFLPDWFSMAPNADVLDKSNSSDIWVEKI
jgi:hypothetical protein